MRSAAIAGSLVLLLACTSDPVDPGDGARPTPSATVESSSSASASASADSPSLRVETIARIQPAELTPTLIDIFGDYVTWSGGDQSSRPNRVVLYDLRTRKSRVIARAEASTGQTDWSRGSGDIVVYTDQAAPSEGQGSSDWTIRSVEISSGRNRVIARGSGTASFAVPSPSIDGPWVAWVQPNSGAGERLDLILFNVETGVKRTVLTGHPEDVEVVSGRLVFSNTSGEGRDVFVVDAGASTAPRRLTRSGRVGRVSAGGSHATYFEPRVGDSRSLWAVSISGGAPIQIAGAGATNMVAGDEFIAWFGANGDVAAAPIRSGSRPLRLQAQDTSVGARLAASGDRIAWGELTAPGGQFKPVVHVARVQPR